jgi:hypothetical protein
MAESASGSVDKSVQVKLVLLGELAAAAAEHIFARATRLTLFSV